MVNVVTIESGISWKKNQHLKKQDFMNTLNLFSFTLKQYPHSNFDFFLIQTKYINEAISLFIANYADFLILTNSNKNNSN